MCLCPGRALFLCLPIVSLISSIRGMKASLSKDVFVFRMKSLAGVLVRVPVCRESRDLRCFQSTWQGR